MARHTEEEFLTSGNVAKRLGISNQYVHTLAKAGRLPVATLTENGLRLYRRADIERIAEERRKSPPRRGGKKRSTKTHQ